METDGIVASLRRHSVVAFIVNTAGQGPDEKLAHTAMVTCGHWVSVIVIQENKTSPLVLKLIDTDPGVEPR